MGKTATILLLIAGLIPSVAAHAESKHDSYNRPEELSTFNKILFVESTFLFNAWLASENPNTYGEVLAVLAPLATINANTSETTRWAGLIAGESIAAYNIGLDANKESRDDIFKNNVIAWHLFAATVGISGYISGDFDSDHSLRLSPGLDGRTHLVYRMSF